MNRWNDGVLKLIAIVSIIVIVILLTNMYEERRENRCLSEDRIATRWYGGRCEMYYDGIWTLYRPVLLEMKYNDLSIEKGLK